MKNLKKLLAMALALLMILSLAVTAFAAGETNGKYTITINNPNAGHTYEAYQIFVADLHNQAESDDKDGTEAVLSNFEWGESVEWNETDNGVVIGKDDQDNAIYSKDAAEVAKALADGDLQVEDLVAGLPLTKIAKESVFVDVEEPREDYYIITELPAGYYLVKDKTGSQDGKFDAYTDYIVEVVENSVVNPKSSVPSVNKYVKDINDSLPNSETDWQISADHDIGDSVPFKIVATLARNVSSFKGPYKLVFHDTIGAGFTYTDKDKAGIKIYLDENPDDENPGVLVHDAQNPNDHISVTFNGTALTITVDDAKEIGAGNSDKIIIEYSATLNEDAIHYDKGNTNSVILEYANDPTWDADRDTDDSDEPPTGETPPAVVIVYTYKLQVDKVRKNPAYDPDLDDNKDGDDDKEFIPLEGAGFTLYKKNAEGHYVAVGDEITGVTEFVWAGLDDGDYKLSETTTPAGYNTAEDREFTITAIHDAEKVNHELTVKGDDDMKIIGDALATVVENKPGAVLPETGGMGTTVFYLIGGVMVAAAVVLLVTKKRMSSAE